MTDMDVFGGDHIVKSMRSSGYKNTAYALAELIDNSVEAKAKNIEVLCAQKPNYSSKRNIDSIDMIAVADNGEGMDKKVLQHSLVMGEGTRYEAKEIGKFGMGLPNSSMSQCKKVEVYSWKKRSEVYYAYIDLDKLKNNKLIVKNPQKSTLPKIWKEKSNFLKNAKSGTLVVWSKIDRISWKKPTTLFNNCERSIGRIYRKFIINKELEIRFTSFNLETNKISNDKKMKANDPLYLMVPSNTPAPWDKKPMFQIDGDNLEESISVSGHNVQIRCTFATKECREEKGGQRAGSQEHGKHANSNLGISVIRANRELYMDTNLCQTYDPLERWWGVEIEFPNELDEIFGVTNNKQDASNFSAMTHYIGSLSRNEEGINSDEHDEHEVEDLYKLVRQINTRIRSMRSVIKSQNVKQKSDDETTGGDQDYSDPDSSPTVTGADEPLPRHTNEKAIIEALSRIFSPEEASKEAKYILDNKIKTKIYSAPLSNYFFFDVTLKGGVAIITLNKDHMAYKHLVEILENVPDDINPKNAKELLDKVKAALSLVFVSWANYENHTIDNDERRKLSDVRYRWSGHLDGLMKKLEDG